MSAPYPWLENAWRGLAASLDADRLAHAYLVAGRAGLGKHALAHAFARLVLCEARVADAPCAACRSCRLLDSGYHPDLKVVMPAEAHKPIVVDQIRELSEFYALKPHYQARKLALIQPAERMNTAAANALLKLLEEPPPGALLMLLAHRPGRLAATIVSRCQKIKLRDPDWQSCISWLEAQKQEQAPTAAAQDWRHLTLYGAPLQLIEQLASGQATLLDRLIDTLGQSCDGALGVLAAARRHSGDDVREVLDGVELLLRAVAQLQQGHEPRHLRLGAGRVEHLQAIANKLNSRGAFLFLDRLVAARTTVHRSSGVRAGDIVENLLYCWARISQAETTA